MSSFGPTNRAGRSVPGGFAPLISLPAGTAVPSTALPSPQGSLATLLPQIFDTDFLSAMTLPALFSGNTGSAPTDTAPAETSPPIFSLTLLDTTTSFRRDLDALYKELLARFDPKNGYITGKSGELIHPLTDAYHKASHAVTQMKVTLAKLEGLHASMERKSISSEEGIIEIEKLGREFKRQVETYNKQIAIFGDIYLEKGFFVGKSNERYQDIMFDHLRKGTISADSHVEVQGWAWNLTAANSLQKKYGREFPDNLFEAARQVFRDEFGAKNVSSGAKRTNFRVVNETPVVVTPKLIAQLESKIILKAIELHWQALSRGVPPDRLRRLERSFLPLKKAYIAFKPHMNLSSGAINITPTPALLDLKKPATREAMEELARKLEIEFERRANQAESKAERESKAKSARSPMMTRVPALERVDNYVRGKLGFSRPIPVLEADERLGIGQANYVEKYYKSKHPPRRLAHLMGYLNSQTAFLEKRAEDVTAFGARLTTAVKQRKPLPPVKDITNGRFTQFVKVAQDNLPTTYQQVRHDKRYFRIINKDAAPEALDRLHRSEKGGVVVARDGDEIGIFVHGKRNGAKRTHVIFLELTKFAAFNKMYHGGHQDEFVHSLIEKAVFIAENRLRPSRKDGTAREINPKAVAQVASVIMETVEKDFKSKPYPDEVKTGKGSKTVRKKVWEIRRGNLTRVVYSNEPPVKNGWVGERVQVQIAMSGKTERTEILWRQRKKGEWVRGSEHYAPTPPDGAKRFCRARDTTLKAGVAIAQMKDAREMTGLWSRLNEEVGKSKLKGRPVLVKAIPPQNNAARAVRNVVNGGAYFFGGKLLSDVFMAGTTQDWQRFHHYSPGELAFEYGFSTGSGLVGRGITGLTFNAMAGKNLLDRKIWLNSPTQGFKGAAFRAGPLAATALISDLWQNGRVTWATPVGVTNSLLASGSLVFAARLLGAGSLLASTSPVAKVLVIAAEFAISEALHRGEEKLANHVASQGGVKGFLLNLSQSITPDTRFHLKSKASALALGNRLAGHQLQFQSLVQRQPS